MASLRPSSNPKCLFPSFLILSLSMLPFVTPLFFNFTSFHDNGGDINLQGDAYISSGDGHIELTTNIVHHNSLSSSGRAIYSSLLPLWDKASGELADITTHFSLVINSLNDMHHGDGFVFFLADPALPNIDEAKGGGVGLLRGDQVLDSDPFHFLGVEFDTFPNDFDPPYEHVGIDVNSLESSVHVGWCNSVMQGKENDVWISYDSVANNLSVTFSGYCNGSDTKFQHYLQYKVDLASFLPEKVVIGFAAATGVVSELHIIKSWYLNSSLTIAPSSAPPSGPAPPSGQGPSPNHLAYWVGGSIGGIVIVLVIITLICICKRRRNASDRLIHSSAERQRRADVAADEAKDGELSSARRRAIGNEEDVSTQFHTSTEGSISSTNGHEINLTSPGGGREERVIDEAGSSNRHGSERYSPQAIDEELRNYRGPTEYSYDELARATNDFNEQEKVGKGGYGIVYRGTLGTVKIAVKVSTASKELAKQYAWEIKTIGRAQYKNLVKLLGWCHEKDELLLVYEFLPNGSLDTHILDTHKSLLFEFRYNIVVGLAEALHYLQEGLDGEYVVHRDIKCSNILLTSNFTPKLADFGLARLVDRKKLEYTTQTAGTFGYVAPELLSEAGKASKSTDMYSLGVVVLVVACGKKATWSLNSESPMGLVPWVRQLHGKGRLLDAADPRLGRGFDEKKMRVLLMVGLQCTDQNWEKRLTIEQVLKELNGTPTRIPSLFKKMHTLP